MDDPNTEAFRILTMEEFNAMTTDGRAKYLRRAVDHGRQEANKSGLLPTAPPDKKTREE